MFPQELQTYVACNYFAPCWERSIVMIVYVCLSVHSYTSTTTRLNFTKFSVHVIWGCGSVLIWRQWNAIYFWFLWIMSCFHIMGT